MLVCSSVLPGTVEIAAASETQSNLLDSIAARGREATEALHQPIPELVIKANG
jgi:hypothetical protein